MPEPLTQLKQGAEALDTIKKACQPRKRFLCWRLVLPDGSFLIGAKYIGAGCWPPR